LIKLQIATEVKEKLAAMLEGIIDRLTQSKDEKLATLVF
jgi:hypothetical protein